MKKFFDNFEEILCVILMGLLIFFLGLQVLARSLNDLSLLLGLGSSVPIPSWTEELGRFCFVWTVYLAIPMATKKMAHVRITAKYLLWGDPVKLGLWIFADVVFFFACLYFAFISFEESYMSLFEFVEYTPTLGWKAGYITMIIPFSLLLTAYRLIEKYVKHKDNLMQVVKVGGEE